MHDLVMQVWGWMVMNPLAGLAVAVVLLLMLWKQPAQTMKLLVALLLLVAVGYLVSAIIHFTMGSAMMKGQMIHNP